MKNILELTAYELREAYEKKELTVPEVTKAYLDNIKEKDSDIKAYITVCEDEAMKKAEEVQAKFDSVITGQAKSEDLAPLAGIPIAIKDNICTLGVKTTCASKMLGNFIPPYNATVMEKINSQDAIVLGKVNMDEFAMGSSTENSAIAITKNPHNLNKVPGGSSGGSAAAVGGNLAPIALGSDTGGSIREPASFCGIVGLKPTYGLVSRYGLVAFASSLDQIGPMTKDVRDNTLLLKAIAGHDKMDSTSANREKVDYTKSLINDVKGLKIGVPKEFFDEGLNEEVKEALEKAIETYKKLGAEVSECSLPVTKHALPAYYIIADAEASSNLGRFDGIRYGYRTKNYESLKDIFRNSRSEGFGPEVKRRIILGTYVLSSGYYDAYYKKAQKVRTVIKKAFSDVFEQFDVILTPTAPTVAWDIGAKVENPLEMYLMDLYTVPINMAGVPAISIPCGKDKEGMPIGMQLIAKHFNEEMLYRVAYTYEQNKEV
ncbi:MAG: Asp-tRNA(Asn)/Glu-tRNA(Gln) amidotransferase subunit GatA [Clostridia bacterium]|nr:Asp-tRNA(Asn)/Glu-tRNA(Gln) amidotransferase subunit GatA [Clostridia bacterium]